jgi:3'-phosphoadenosine 5'-phosphosulfate sulfotransferase (PAPS reductase)/FAD synthetase
VDTGLEYPEVREFVKTIDNVIWLRPKMTFRQVLDRYGYPVISKDQACAISRFRNTNSMIQKFRRIRGWPNGKKGCVSAKWRYMLRAPFGISDACCDIMKKEPMKRFVRETGRHPFVGAMASESKARLDWWGKYGCNAFDLKDPISRPLSHWTEQDILQYLREHYLSIPDVYGKREADGTVVFQRQDEGGNWKLQGCDRTGCMYCGFGLHMEKGENRFDRMAWTHPRQYAYCMDKLGMREVLEYIQNGDKQAPDSQHLTTQSSI